MLLTNDGKEFELVNEDKAQRAIDGTMGSMGKLTGGVGRDASIPVKLAEYDRLGGLVKLNGDKVAKGSFYDFDNKEVRANAQIMLEFVINGKTVLVAADQELPPLVRAAKAAEKGDTEKPGTTGTATAEEGETMEEVPTSRGSSLIGGGKHRGKTKTVKNDDAE